MRALFCTAFALLLLTSCYKRQKSCEDYKTGTFMYRSYSNGELLESKIVRTDTLEIDYFNPQNPDTAVIRWVNDCAYVARKYNPKSQVEKQAYLIQIIQTDENSYTFEFSKVGDLSKVTEIKATRVQ